jgi:hypothetical protein
MEVQAETDTRAEMEVSTAMTPMRPVRAAATTRAEMKEAAATTACTAQMRLALRVVAQAVMGREEMARAAKAMQVPRAAAAEMPTAAAAT